MGDSLARHGANGAGRMSVFLSYARPDRALAAEFAARLEDEGFEVWWDARIAPGAAFDREIEAQIARADVALVLWSPNAVASEWVRAEAAAAHERGKLFPVLCAPCDLPVQFKHVNALDMTHWRGEPRDEAWRSLVEQLRKRRGAARERDRAPFSATAAAVSPGVAGVSAPERDPPIAAIAIGAAIVIFGIIVWALASA